MSESVNAEYIDGFVSAELADGELREQRKWNQRVRGAWWVQRGMSFGNLEHPGRMPVAGDGPEKPRSKVRYS